MKIKRLFIAIAFMVSAISLSVTGYLLARHEITQVCALLENIMHETDPQDEEEIYEKAENLIKKWLESNKILAIILRHSLSREIHQNMLYTENCIHNKDKEELLKACYDSHALLTSVLQSEKPSFRNTF